MIFGRKNIRRTYRDMMNNNTNSPARDLRLFFLITFVWTWLLNLPRLLAASGWISLSTSLSAGLGHAAVFGPSAAAFGLTGIRSGKTGLLALWRSGWVVRFRKFWLLPALFLMPISGLVTFGILSLLHEKISWQAALPPVMLVPVGLLIWLLGALPEEYGWRGYALNLMQVRWGSLHASLILGLLWGLWHLPLHFIPGTTQFIIPVWEFIIQTITLTILYTWLYNSTGGSILITGLFHATGNLTGALIPYWTGTQGRWISFFVLLAPAVLVIFFKFTRRSHPVR
jgi:membrane protease YdiL (CAAX protease family)